MILYTEEVLEDCYKIYRLHQMRKDVPFIMKEDFRLLNNAVWTPDGNAIVARKHFTSGRSLGAGEMWLYHIGGEGGLQLCLHQFSMLRLLFCF